MAQATPMSHHPPSHTPKRPRNLPYRDGASKCAQQYDLYEMIRNPHAPKNRRPPASSSNLNSQAHLSKQKKIEKEIQAEFDKNLWHRFKFIGGLARIIFLVLVLPFYILFFALPKKIVTVFIPYLMGLAKDYVVRCIKKLVGRIASLFARLYNPFKLLWNVLKPSSGKKKKEVQQAFEEQGMGFFAFIAMGLWYLLSPVVNGCYRIYTTARAIIRFIREFPQKCRDLLLKCHTFIQNILAHLKPKAIREKIRQLGIHYCKLVKNKLDALIVARVRKAIHRVHKIIAVYNKIVAGIRKAILFLKKIKQPFVSFYGKIKQIRLTFFVSRKEWGHFIAQGKKWVDQTKDQSIKTFQSGLKPVLNYAISVPSHCLQLVRKQTVSPLRKLYSFIGTRIKRLSAFYANVTGQIGSTVKMFATRFSPLFDSYIYIRKQLNKLPKLKFPNIRTNFKPVPFRFQISVKPLQDIFLRISRQSKAVKDTITHWTNPIFRQISAQWDHFVLRVRIAFAWAKILSVYGMVQVTLVTREIGLGL